jgi:hypothetical protein
MANCTLLEICPFFNDELKSIPGFVEAHKDIYCKGKYETCARYMIFTKLGRECVPSNLFPIQIKRAKAIIEKGCK